MGELFQPTHLLLVAIIAMIFLGPKRLPELGKGLGEGIRGFKDAFTPHPDPKDPKDEPKQVE
jgi:sec-independent protein translocase protein TatA